MIVGLGSGTTASIMVRILAERMEQEGLKIAGVPSSGATADLARQLEYSAPLARRGRRPRYQSRWGRRDRPSLPHDQRARRGIASREDRGVVLASSSHDDYGRKAGGVARRVSPLPVEVSVFGLKHTERRLQKLGASTTIRRLPDGSPVITDNENAIIDCQFSGIDDPSALDCQLQCLAGVLDTGLFVDLCDTLIVGLDDGVELIPKATLRRS